MTTTQRPPGRPPTDPEGPRSVRLRVSITPALMQRLRADAEATDDSLAEVVSRALLERYPAPAE